VNCWGYYHSSATRTDRTTFCARYARHNQIPMRTQWNQRRWSAVQCGKAAPQKGGSASCHFLEGWTVSKSLIALCGGKAAGADWPIQFPAILESHLPPFSVPRKHEIAGATLASNSGNVVFIPTRPAISVRSGVESSASVELLSRNLYLKPLPNSSILGCI